LEAAWTSFKNQESKIISGKRLKKSLGNAILQNAKQFREAEEKKYQELDMTGKIRV